MQLSELLPLLPTQSYFGGIDTCDIGLEFIQRLDTGDG